MAFERAFPLAAESADKFLNGLNERMLPALQLQTYTRLIRTDGMPVLLRRAVRLRHRGLPGGQEVSEPVRGDVVGSE